MKTDLFQSCGHSCVFQICCHIECSTFTASNAVLEYNLKNDRKISVHFQGKPFNITVIQAYAPTSNAKAAEVEWFYEDLQDLLEVTLKKDVLFIIGNWNAEVGSQEIPGVTGKFQNFQRPQDARYLALLLLLLLSHFSRVQRCVTP